MPKICYTAKRFKRAASEVIETANGIIADYERQGFHLTLRQVYYQFVARGLIPNRESEYKRLGAIISDARLAGLIDWTAIQDRTRSLKQDAHWEDPASIIDAAARQYKLDLWRGQPYRPEVWIEKDALVGVIAGVCSELDVPYFSCRGYTSQSEMWVAGRRLLAWAEGGQSPIVFHFGDHDPSGLDMTRDITDRLDLFTGGGVRLDRLALNMDQVRSYGPPPNPAKTTDSRFAGYIADFGRESWELDALEPAAIVALVREAVAGVRDEGIWQKTVEESTAQREGLLAASRRWGEVQDFLGTGEVDEG